MILQPEVGIKLDLNFYIKVYVEAAKPSYFASG